MARTILSIVQVVSACFVPLHFFLNSETELHDDYTLNFQVMLPLCSVFGSTERLISVLAIYYLFVL